MKRYEALGRLTAAEGLRILGRVVGRSPVLTPPRPPSLASDGPAGKHPDGWSTESPA